MSELSALLHALRLWVLADTLKPDEADWVYKYTDANWAMIAEEAWIRLVALYTTEFLARIDFS